ncbi:MAG: hypothetical protein FJ000_08765 [Actinobacteria bacterium]|nr:hypothetical protein [Actinomycetota bacterium]
MVRRLVLGLLAAVLLGTAALCVGCGEDPFVGTWGVDDPMPGTDRLEMVITRDGDTYTSHSPPCRPVPHEFPQGALISPSGAAPLRS